MSNTVNIPNETFVSLLEELKITDYVPSSQANYLINASSRYLKDLKINVTNVLQNNQHLSKKEAALLAYAVAINEHVPILKTAFEKLAVEAGATEAEIAEIAGCTSLLNANNVLYRFRHFVKKDFYNTQPAGIKMNIMLNPVTGKEFFELASLVVSAVNGCEQCVVSHEQSVLANGSFESKIFEAIKLASVIKSLCVVID
jgi:alkyl hydroperoxide reductase subunit D